jgi:hypothetical protein
MTVGSDGTGSIPSGGSNRVIGRRRQPTESPNLRPRKLPTAPAPASQACSLRRNQSAIDHVLHIYRAPCALRTIGYEHPIDIGDSRLSVEHPSRMTLSLPNPSSRLLRAAAAEQADLARHRDGLARRRNGLVAELRELDEALAAADQRLDVLARLVDPLASPAAQAEERGEPGHASTAPHAPEATDGHDGRVVLRGPAIREVAVRVLISQPEQIDAVHYRRWYELLEEAGYGVAGKDPLAVFLTQVSRSPVVRKSSQPGVYEVDRQASLRIRQRLERLQAELREVALTSSGPVELATVRARRHELDVAISQQERALEEAIRVLAAHPGAEARAAGSSARRSSIVSASSAALSGR